MYAILNGRPEIFKLLLKHPKIDVNLQGNIGDTILISTSEIGQKQIVELLIQYPQSV